MEIKIREIDKQTVKGVNQFENIFTVNSHLAVSAENGKISYFKHVTYCLFSAASLPGTAAGAKLC